MGQLYRMMITVSSTQKEIPVTTSTQPSLHIVIASIECNQLFVGYTAVTAPLTWDEAIAKWEELEDHRHHTSAGGSVVRGQHPRYIRQFAVRSIDDPRFAPLVGRGYADAVDRKTGKRSYKGDDGDVKAAKAWAKLYGYEGRSGGWIYSPAGHPVIQGWKCFADYLRRGKKIAKGSDGKWYILDRELVS